MSDSLIQSDLSELVIGLSSEHSYREITPTHTHTCAVLYASTGTIQVLRPIMCGLCHPCARYGFQHM